MKSQVPKIPKPIPDSEFLTIQKCNKIPRNWSTKNNRKSKNMIFNGRTPQRLPVARLNTPKFTTEKTIVIAGKMASCPWAKIVLGNNRMEIINGIFVLIILFISLTSKSLDSNIRRYLLTWVQLLFHSASITKGFAKRIQAESWLLKCGRSG